MSLVEGIHQQGMWVVWMGMVCAADGDGVMVDCLCKVGVDIIVKQCCLRLVNKDDQCIFRGLFLQCLLTIFAGCRVCKREC